MTAAPSFRIGLDLGGTKIAGVALDAKGNDLARHRVATPADYAGILKACADLVAFLENKVGGQGSVGMCMPGAVDTIQGRVRFSPNIHPLAGQNLVADMRRLYGREVRIANDAACFALSEASDGAAAGAHQVYGVILGTGVGGTLVTDGKLSPGPNAMQEWGHVPLPWAESTDTAPRCGCGRMGCIEAILSGPALHRQVKETLKRDVSNDELRTLIAARDPAIMPVMDVYCTRLAKACAMLALIFDPDMIVFGGGVSNLDIIYEEVPSRIGKYTVLPDIATKLVKAKHGDDSGMRGAAWLWPL